MFGATRLMSRAVRTRQMSAAAIESGTRSVNGVDLFYMASGRSGLPLICLPGALGEQVAQRALHWPLHIC